MKHIMLWVFAYFLGSQWQASKFFPFSSLCEENGSRYALCFIFFLCDCGELWNISPGYPKVIRLILKHACFWWNVLWKWKGLRKLKSQDPQAKSASQVSVRFVSCVNNCLDQKYCRVLSGLNFQKPTSRIWKVNYRSIVIVLINSVWVPKSASLFK